MRQLICDEEDLYSVLCPAFFLLIFINIIGHIVLAPDEAVSTWKAKRIQFYFKPYIAYPLFHIYGYILIKLIAPSLVGV